MHATPTEPNPYESPKTGTADERRWPKRLLDVWFAAFPLLAVAFYAHWIAFLEHRGVTTFSPYLPEGHPGHVSDRQFWWMFAEIWAFAMTWLFSAIVICVMVRRRPAIHRKRAWCWFALLLAPIACPICYFRKLKGHGRVEVKDAT